MLKSTIITALCSAVLFSQAAWPVNINTADASALAAEISGVGEKLATSIVLYRKQHGPFKSIDDLTSVKGIGSKLLEKNRDKLQLNSKATVKAKS
ncbi:MAG TPA: helix-hairpin-helix domain-containing protein [Gammaproteobacteria bacterium]|nr:helix-hairpin-helix domain-containing protein [Gammaproteobacteria bacterium]